MTYTRRYAPRATAAALSPPRRIASGRRSESDTPSMKPAAKATRNARTDELHRARMVTIAAPATFASAATPPAASAGEFTRAPLDGGSRGRESETRHRGVERLGQLRRRFEIVAAEFPTARGHDAPLLEAESDEEIQPPVAAAVDEQLEMRIDGELVLGRVDRDLGPARRCERRLDPPDRILHVRERDCSARPVPLAPAIVDRHVHRRGKMVQQYVEQIDATLGVRHHMRGVVVRLANEGESVEPGPESPPYGCLGLSPTKERHARCPRFAVSRPARLPDAGPPSVAPAPTVAHGCSGTDRPTPGRADREGSPPVAAPERYRHRSNHRRRPQGRRVPLHRETHCGPRAGRVRGRQSLPVRAHRSHAAHSSEPPRYAAATQCASGRPPPPSGGSPHPASGRHRRACAPSPAR